MTAPVISAGDLVGDGLTVDDLMTLLSAWDDVSSAIDRVILAQPAQMTGASANLEEQRKMMRAVINHVTRTRARSSLNHGEKP